MIVFSFGLPGIFSEWVAGVIYGLLQMRGTRIARENLEKVDDLISALLSTEYDDLLICSRHPDATLAKKILDSNQRIILALDDAKSTAKELIQAYPITLVDSVRQVSSSLSKLFLLGINNKTLIVRSNYAFNSTIDTIIAISKYIKLECSEQDAIIIASKLDLLLNEMKKYKKNDIKLSLNDQRMLSLFLEPVERSIVEGGDINLIAIREMFVIGDTPTKPADSIIDITGRARILFGGPYINLPQGRWTVRFVLAFSESAIDVPYRAQVTSSESGGEVIGDVVFVPNEAGRMDVSVPFYVSDPGSTIEFRLVLNRAAFDGEIALGFAEIRSVAKTSAKLASEWNAGLDPG